MKTIQVNKMFFPGVGLGKDKEGNNVFVLNGDLYLDNVCDAFVDGNLAVPVVFNYEISELIKGVSDKDGLICISKLKEISKSTAYNRIFEIKGKWCFPYYSSKDLVEIAFNNNLWSQAKIKISKTRYKSIARAMLFGVDFKKAIINAINSGISVTHLYCPHKKDWSEFGIFADFLIKITKTKDGNIEFNSWQAIDKEEVLYFVHGILDKPGNFFSHLDFAYHYSNLQEIYKLISTHKEKPNLIFKEKIFRLDGQIELAVGFKLMHNFFPIDYLIDEYYQESSGVKNTS